MTSQQSREDTKPKEEIVNKFSNKGDGQLREAAIVDKKSCFLQYFCGEDSHKKVEGILASAFCHDTEWNCLEGFL